MNKIKQLLLLVCLAGCFAACTKDSPVDDFDYQGQFKTDTTLIRKFITDNKIPALVDKRSGMFYQIIALGTRTDTVKYVASTLITAPYEGRFLDGSVFEKGTLTSFPIGNTIPGWQFGIPYIQKGGSIRLFIPSYYAYGKEGYSKVPPNTVLDFTISLTDVK